MKGAPQRDGLLVHPDGGPFGTEGCIGLQGRCAQTLLDILDWELPAIPRGRKSDFRRDLGLPLYVLD
jgi:hypothetical protein